jgi:hypothetical protein
LNAFYKKKSMVKWLLCLWLCLCSAVALAESVDWAQLQTDMTGMIEDRQALLNEFFNDEAPQLQLHGWPDNESRFMVMAQGRSLITDRNNQYDQAWQDRHNHAHSQWNDFVIEGKPKRNWRYFINMNVAADDVMLDEGFATFALGYGIQLKVGQFFSGFGRLNSQHTHDRDFIDAPLVYKDLFGQGTALQEKGVQLSYIPTKTWMLGIEQLSATNREQFNDDRAKPALTNAFSRWGAQWGNGFYSLLGVSLAQGQLKGNAEQQSAYWSGLDMTLKQWLTHDNYWQLQGEWLRREAQGAAIYGVDNEQGYYLLGLYRWHPQWRAGLRYEHTQSENKLSADITRQSMLLENDASDWLRIRLQLGQEEQSTGLNGVYLLLGWQASLHWLP